MEFFIGLHHAGDAQHFTRACISINELRRRKKAPIDCDEVLVDSAAFTELARFGRYRHEPGDYARELRRLHESGIVEIAAAVAQDYMCEPFMLAKTGLSVTEHQRLTIERYDALVAGHLPFPIMPVLQGYRPEEYANHLHAYGARLGNGAWVGVGSVCKRNGKPDAIFAVLSAIKAVRPDLRLHGFGVKRISLEDRRVRKLLHSSDSMAWSFAARYEGRNGNSVGEAIAYGEIIDRILRQDRRLFWEN